MTAAATLAAVGAGITAGPAMAATGSAGTVLVASHTAALSSAAAAAPAPLDPQALPALKSSPLAPHQVPAQSSPLAVPALQSSPLDPHQVPAQTPKSAAQAGQATAAVNSGQQAAPVAHGTAQPPAPAQQPAPQQPAPQQPAPQQPAPQPQPYLIYDSVTPSAIPPHQAVATYATGGYAVPAANVANRGRVLWIDTRGTDPGAQALDVEPGCASPATAATWASARLTAQPNVVARVYTMISEWPAVKAAIATLPPWMQSRVHYWIADPTGVNHVVPGSWATQWYWGHSYDISTAQPGF